MKRTDSLIWPVFLSRTQCSSPHDKNVPDQHGWAREGHHPVRHGDRSSGGVCSAGGQTVQPQLQRKGKSSICGLHTPGCAPGYFFLAQTVKIYVINYPNQEPKKKKDYCVGRASATWTKLMLRVLGWFHLVILVNYCKTPFISTYLFSVSATVQVYLSSGAVLTFGGMIRRSENPARKKSAQSSAFRRQHAVVHVSAIMHILRGYMATYNYQYIEGGGGGVLSGHCCRQQVSVKKWRVLIFGGVLIYRVFRYSVSAEASRPWPWSSCSLLHFCVSGCLHGRVPAQAVRAWTACHCCRQHVWKRRATGKRTGEPFLIVDFENIPS